VTRLFSDETARLPAVVLDSDGPISNLVRQRDILTYRAAADVVWPPPYKRTSDGPDKYRRVLLEEGGTCSSKHALLAALAREEEIPVSLVLVFYELNGYNTPGADKTLRHYGLDAVPESHAWLEYQDHWIDITDAVHGSQPNLNLSQRRIYFRLVIIQPEDIGSKRHELHRVAIQDWLTRKHLRFSVDQILAILAECKSRVR
jgi:hypothetical protein